MTESDIRCKRPNVHIIVKCCDFCPVNPFEPPPPLGLPLRPPHLPQNSRKRCPLVPLLSPRLTPPCLPRAGRATVTAQTTYPPVEAIPTPLRTPWGELTPRRERAANTPTSKSFVQTSYTTNTRVYRKLALKMWKNEKGTEKGFDKDWKKLIEDPAAKSVRVSLPRQLA